MFDEVPYQLPDTWTWASLDELLETLESGGRPRGGVKKYSEGIPSIGGEHLDGKGGFRLDNIRFIPKDYYQNMTKGKIKNLDILVVKDGATTGKTSIASPEFPFKEAAVNEHVFILRTIRDVVEPYYVFRFLSSIQGQNQILQRFQGTAQGGINSKFIEGFPVPLPPTKEQRRIVARVEALFAESKTAREALDKVPVLLRTFRQSVLAKAFRGELTQRNPSDEPAQKLLERIRQERNKGKQTSLTGSQKEPSVELPKLPETWIWTTIGELETFIGSGITPRGGKKVYRIEGIPFIRSQNVHSDGLHLENIAYVTPEMHAEMKRTHVRSNDVLLNITGASIGRSTYIPEGFGEANVNQHVCIIRTGWWIIPAYLSHFLNSTYGQDQIFATESGVTREGLNYTQVRSLWIPLAPVAEQKRVAAKIEEAFSIAEKIEDAVRRARERAERIDQAILAKAFRGELVPQDPNDEPASVLLECIKSKTKQPTTIQTKLAN